MFAGPNGSGKSTAKTLLSSQLLGAYINPDELQQQVEKTGCCDLSSFGIEAIKRDVSEFFAQSPLMVRAGLETSAAEITTKGTVVTFGSFEGPKIAYLASVLADLVRRELLREKKTFTFETVMSSADKVVLLQEAKRQGFRTYLYFIATEDPAINISRVQARVKLGGHDVPVEKIESRYWRSLDLLVPAIRETDRAFIFDNSGADLKWVAEVTNGKKVTLQEDSMPSWFESSVWNKVRPDTQ